MSTTEPLAGPTAANPTTNATANSGAAPAVAPVHGSVLDAIGSTGSIRLRRTASHVGSVVHVRAEFLNPRGSVEGTPGSTGARPAVVGAQFGCPLVVVTPGGVPRDDEQHVQTVVGIDTGGRVTGTGEHLEAVAAGPRETERGGPGDVVVVVLPDSGRAHLPTDDDEGRLGEFGFLAADAREGTRVRDVLPVGALDDPGPITLGANLTVAGAVEAAVAAGALGRTPLAVVLDRVGAEGPRALEDVVGSATLAGLRALVRQDTTVGDVPLRAVADPALPHVGAGQDVVSASAALGGAPAAWVLEGGRVVGWVRQARLSNAVVAGTVAGPGPEDPGAEGDPA